MDGGVEGEVIEGGQSEGLVAGGVEVLGVEERCCSEYWTNKHLYYFN